jgi:chromosome segregation ATPase
MASGGDRPDLDALRELEEVLRHLESELAGWRRRALGAESRITDLGGAGGAAVGRLQELEAQNAALGQRLSQAKTRVADLLDRLRFLEQQRGNGGQNR